MPATTINASDGSGVFSAYTALPVSGRGPGMVVIQEIFGVNKFLRDLCDHYAALGYVAICPDLFWRLEPGLDLDSTDAADSAKAFGLFPQFNVEKGVEDIAATIATLGARGDATGKVGCVGYCLGGKLAYLAATRTGADISVGYYGVGIQDLLGEASAIVHPLMLHVAEEDKFTPPPALQAIRDSLARVPLAQVHVYPGMDHAFARVGGDHYDEAAAALANQRTEAFFAEYLLA